MTKDELAALGLSAEQIERVLALGQAELDGARSELDGARGELAAANRALERLRERPARPAAEVERLRGELAELQSRYDADLAAVRLDAALDSALLMARSRDPRAVRPFLDLSRISLQNGALSGLDEQLDALREEKSFLFEDAIPLCTGIRHSHAAGRPSGTAQANAAIRAALSGKQLA